MSLQRWWKRAFDDNVFPLAQLSQSAQWRSQTRQENRFLQKAFGPPRGQRLLDLCCGVGRHAIPLAKRGFNVTGLDFSRPYLADAKRAARAEKADVRWVRRDMRRIGFKAAFDGAYCLYTSFGYFTRAEDDLKVLRGVRRALKPGGLFVLETVNGPLVSKLLRKQAELGLPAERWVEWEDGSLVLEAPELIGKHGCRTRWIFINGKERKDLVSFVRLYGRDSLGKALRSAGFTGLRFFGAIFPKSQPYRPQNSPRLIVVAKAP